MSKVVEICARLSKKGFEVIVVLVLAVALILMCRIWLPLFLIYWRAQ